MSEELEEVVENDKKEKKKEKKEKKEKKKKDKDKDSIEELEQEETVGSKIMVGFVTFLIILIWLAIFGVLIKFDVGGFGSSVLYPVLKDVPYLNKILPEKTSVTIPGSTEYQYDSLDDAIDRIKELELELDTSNAALESEKAANEELQTQNSELLLYKEEQVNFEVLKQKFYEEVIFSDEAPDINEYKTYYESIDPENAAVLYKQVVEQVQYDEKVNEYVKTYSAMKPKEAAAIFNTMTDNLQLVADILQKMDASSRAKIMGKMDPTTAAKVTAIMEPDAN